MTDIVSVTTAGLDFRALYRQAFEAFGAAALWNKARIDDPTPEHAWLSPGRCGLRVTGKRASWRKT